MADTRTIDRARRLREFIEQSRNAGEPMRRWLARRASVANPAVSNLTPEALAERAQQGERLRRAMSAPGAINIRSDDPRAPAATTTVASTTPIATTAPTSPTTSVPPQSQPQAQPQQPSRFADAAQRYTDDVMNAGGLVDTSDWTPADFQAAALAGYGSSDYSPLVTGVPGSMQANSWASSAVYRQRHPVDPTAQARATAESNALRAAQTASMGMLTEGPMSTPVSNPSEAFARFAQSGYTGAQALADGWGAGTGRPGWETQPGWSAPLNAQGLMGAPYVNQTPAVSPQSSDIDPYHPPGYTPGVAAPSAPPVTPSQTSPATPPSDASTRLASAIQKTNTIAPERPTTVRTSFRVANPTPAANQTVTDAMNGSNSKGNGMIGIKSGSTYRVGLG